MMSRSLGGGRPPAPSHTQRARIPQRARPFRVGGLQLLQGGPGAHARPYDGERRRGRPRVGKGSGGRADGASLLVLERGGEERDERREAEEAGEGEEVACEREVRVEPENGRASRSPLPLPLSRKRRTGPRGGPQRAYGGGRGPVPPKSCSLDATMSVLAAATTSGAATVLRRAKNGEPLLFFLRMCVSGVWKPLTKPAFSGRALASAGGNFQ